MKFRFRQFSATLAAALALFSVRLASAMPDVSRPLDVSLDGHRSDYLFNLTTVSVTILFAIMVVMLVWTLVFHRDRPGRKAHYEQGIDKKHLLFTALIGGAIFFGVDGVLLAHSFADLRDAFWKFPTAAENPVQIEVYAQQWAWNFRYPGSDGKFNTEDDIVTLNDLRLPTNRPVHIKIKSKDVIHSFYLPNFRVKQDAMPGSVTQLWFQAKQTGQFEIGCAQHCGANHYKMRGVLTLLDADQYKAWATTEEVSAKRRYDENDRDAHWGWEWESEAAARNQANYPK